MNRLLLITTLLAFLAVVMAPVVGAVIPHHDNAEVPHAAQDDDCGCMCHVALDAVVAEHGLDIHLISAAAEHFYSHSLPDPIPTSFERPPELLS
ncbi:MAG TPA: hypothetical protein VGL38_03730 [bacterium]|jgi:hypothetical protein